MNDSVAMFARTSDKVLGDLWHDGHDLLVPDTSQRDGGHGHHIVPTQDWLCIQQ